MIQLLLILNLLHCFQVLLNHGNFSVFDQARDSNSGKMDYLAHGKKSSLSPEQSMELFSRDATLLFLPAWPHPTEELFGQGSCCRNKTNTSHAWKIDYTLVFQVLGG